MRSLSTTSRSELSEDSDVPHFRVMLLASQGRPKTSRSSLPLVRPLSRMNRQPSRSTLLEPTDVLYRIKRGLSGYVSYLAACQMNESFSEYVPYEPMLRILTARNYSVECEVECPGIKQPKAGDRKRLDFVANGHNTRFAIEVKWAQSRKLDVQNDHEKLAAFVASCANGTDRAFCACSVARATSVDLRSSPMPSRSAARQSWHSLA
jgi:hypothetical protein